VPRALGKSLCTLARENGQWVGGHEKLGNVPCSSKTGCMARTCRELLDGKLGIAMRVVERSLRYNSRR
jgi:hypothetical protein